ncbi:MAG: glycosyltransferase family 4 protein, partial [Terriglobales bacterium]
GFGVPAANVRSFVAHGIMSRIGSRLHRYIPNTVDSMLHPSFGRWAARSLRPDSDVVYGFSGVMEEILSKPPPRSKQLRVMVRASAHIREQAQILDEEQERVGASLDGPSDWMIDREEREYELADKIVVLSRFAFKSFLSQGVPPNRLERCRLGVDLGHFRASDIVIAERVKRVVGGAPLRVLTTGTFSYRKGARDLADVAAALSKKMVFRFVGDQLPETSDLAHRSSQHIEFIDRQPEKSLVRHYDWADVFFFPTVEDGFPAVLLQAAAAGLPIIATPNCSAPDFVVEGKTGWICPVRDANGFIRRLSWCDENRDAFAMMSQTVSRANHEWDWVGVAGEFVSMCLR